MFSVLFSGQGIVLAEEDQYSGDLIPTMTSNTAPSGTVTASSIWSVKNHQPFHAFDDSDGMYGWCSAEGALTGWVAYEFNNPVKIEKYTLKPRKNNIDGVKEQPKTWTFEGWDGTNWVVLNTQADVTDWAMGQIKEFTFSNQTSFNKYRINITANNGSRKFVTIGEMEMMEKINSTPNPEPEPEPEPNPTGDNALLVIKMISGLEKEFELSASEVQEFIDWYNGRADGRGKETYMFDKDFNKGPFTSRKDYVAFSKIQSLKSWNIPNNTMRHILKNRKVPHLFSSNQSQAKTIIKQTRLYRKTYYIKKI
ncbi:discoidin domain-containing protein [Brevibacillus fortis]|uniref:discoidin domain-containing protein n=1 Tax=Brevibacillus fortis TaxID=2126352 RepID=UPI0038FC9041